MIADDAHIIHNGKKLSFSIWTTSRRPSPCGRPVPPIPMGLHWLKLNSSETGMHRIYLDEAKILRDWLSARIEEMELSFIEGPFVALMIGGTPSFGTLRSQRGAWRFDRVRKDMPIPNAATVMQAVTRLGLSARIEEMER